MLPVETLNFYLQDLLAAASNLIADPGPIQELAVASSNLPEATCPASLIRLGADLRARAADIYDHYTTVIARDSGQTGRLPCQLYRTLYSRSRDSRLFYAGWQELSGHNAIAGYLSWSVGLDRITAVALAATGQRLIDSAGELASTDSRTRTRVLQTAQAAADQIAQSAFQAASDLNALRNKPPCDLRLASDLDLLPS